MEENKKDVLPLEGEPLTTPQISEPVVNALAAALNKIETYVPTQYINDGPPDIDAEHLNHAEQAIMRVTNLANGAADAIAALQSQVTQLNSDLSGTKTTTDILSDALKVSDGIHEYNLSGASYTGDLPDSNYAYGNGTVYRRNVSAIMVVLYGATQESIATNYSNNGKTWHGWKVHALKSDFKVLKKTDVQFSDGFAKISFPGLTYDSVVCVNQEYRSSDGVKNLVFTAQVRPNELIIYARNAGDGSSYNGILNIMVIAIEQ